VGSLYFIEQESQARLNYAPEEFLQQFNRFMTVSKLDEGVVALEPTKIPIAKALEITLQGLTEELEGKDIRVRVSSSVKSAALVTDELLLYELLEEVLQNAIRYSEEGTVTITSEYKKGSIRLQITDTGIGITPEEQKHLFEKFFRGERARKMHEGNGLGLYFSHHIAKILGGSINISSRVGKGTVCTITLPQKRRA
jgi:signal transduction histidine kinase